MSILAETFSEATEKAMSLINMGMIAVIEKFDPEKMMADVQPLAKQAGKNFAPLANVPVQFVFGGGVYIRPEYKKGDLVWIAFSRFDMDAPLSGNMADAEREQFNMQNCSVVAGIAPSNFAAPQSFSKSGIIIGKGENFLNVTDSGFQFVFGASGEKKTTITENGIETSGKIKADKEITAMAITPATQINVSTHQHPSAPPGPPSPPKPG